MKQKTILTKKLSLGGILKVKEFKKKEVLIMLNRVTLMGRLVADPELKTTASGISVTSFRIAVERNYVKPGEERKADFFDVVCWRNSAEFVCKYFNKGSMIALDGQLQSRVYQAKDGTNRYITEVVASQVSFTGEKRIAQNNAVPVSPAPTVPTPAPVSYATPEETSNDNLPIASETSPEPIPLLTSYTNPEDIPDDDLPF